MSNEIIIGRLSIYNLLRLSFSIDYDNNNTYYYNKYSKTNS
jgi:hypothetical protein